MAQSRRQSIDVYRGLALLAMAVYHACWDLTYYRLIDAGIGVDPVWVTFQRAVLTAFLLLAGASLTLGHGDGIRWRSFWRREAILVGAALATSLGTYLLFGDYFAYFGVLHAIALFSLLALLLVTAPLWISILVTVAALILPALYSSDAFDPRWLNWLGFFRVTPETADLVPVFPWFGVFLIGMLAMRLFRNAAAFTWSTPNRAVRAVGFLGRWSLIAYLLHQPLLFGIITPIANYLNNAETAKLESFTRSCEVSCNATKGKAEGAGGPQFCSAYCQCALESTVRDNLWSAPADQLKSMSALCTAMAE